MPSSHSGTVATSSAASPDGTVFSPMPTSAVGHQQQHADDRAAPPFRPAGPRTTRSRPAARAAARWLRSASGNMIRPATRFRAAAISSGGIVSTPTRMAR